MAGIRAAWRRLPMRIRAVLIIVGLQCVIATAFRIAFWAAFRQTGGQFTVDEVLAAWYLGAKFDLRLALLVSLPFLATAWPRALDPSRAASGRALWLGYFVAAELVVAGMYLVDFGHYAYTGERLNAGLVDLMLSPAEALRMVWESYSVPAALAVMACIGVAYGAALSRTAFRAFDHRGARLRPWPRTGVLVACAAAYGLGIYGKWSWYPLRWSDAFGTTDGFLSALALNPVLYFFDTLPDRGAPYDVDAVKKHYGLLASHLDLEDADPASLSFVRHVVAQSPPRRRANLVLIHLESFAAHKTGFHGNPLNPTPAFDSLARGGIAFTHFFVPTGPTARSVFTVLTGIPDLSPTRSSSRNPRLVRQHTLVNALEGYEKFYFLGGSASWGNIRGVLAHNIQGLRIFEEGDYDAPREDVWGVSDLALFEKAHAVLRASSRPVFALIQTSANHAPYTLPAYRGRFEPAEVDAETLATNGFQSLKAYNGIRFLDYALGEFFRLAREAPYFENTVFVLFGDHGMRRPRHTPWDELRLTDVHVPLVIYAPGLVPGARRVDAVASLVDVLPTSLGLLGLSYVNTALGRDLLAPRPPESRFAFVAGGLLTNDLLLRVDPRGEVHLYQYRSATPAEELRERLPGVAAELHQLYEAVYETARYLAYHNPPRPHRGTWLAGQHAR